MIQNGSEKKSAKSTEGRSFSIYETWQFLSRLWFMKSHACWLLRKMEWET